MRDENAPENPADDAADVPAPAAEPIRDRRERPWTAEVHARLARDYSCGSPRLKPISE